MNRLQKLKGTMDILPGESEVWQYIEKVLAETARLSGFSEIRTPTIELTDLFCRGVGDTTDVVSKEMYSFDDKDGSNISLRPEGTAGVARAVIENGLYAGAMPLKLYYTGSFFRREKPQAGRSREFTQFGTELYGSTLPEADAEVILLARDIFRRFGLSGIKLHINSIGCPECRPDYRNALIEYFSAHSGELCDTCRERLMRNPLRVLDCKNPSCRALAKDAPKTLDHLCGDCRTHFDSLCGLLDACGVEYVTDPSVVRGLDYYTGTVFEFIAESIGAQSTVCGGGRYDGLLESIGGPALPAVGFGMGITRLIQALRDEDLIPQPDTGADIYIAPMGADAAKKAFALAEELRCRGVSGVTDLCARSVKAQMKYADKTHAKYALVIGGSELESGVAELRPMRGGESIKTDLSIEGIISAIRE